MKNEKEMLKYALIINVNKELSINEWMATWFVEFHSFAIFQKKKNLPYWSNE